MHAVPASSEFQMFKIALAFANHLKVLGMRYSQPDLGPHPEYPMVWMAALPFACFKKEKRRRKKERKREEGRKEGRKERKMLLYVHSLAFLADA